MYVMSEYPFHLKKRYIYTKEILSMINNQRNPEVPILSLYFIMYCKLKIPLKIYVFPL